MNTPRNVSYAPAVLAISVVSVTGYGGARVDENPGRRVYDSDAAVVERSPVRVDSSRVVGVRVLDGRCIGCVVDETLGVEDGRDEALRLLLPRHRADILLLMLLLLLLQRSRRQRRLLRLHWWRQRRRGPHHALRQLLDPR